MIARIWHGMVPVSKGDEYLDLMRRIALPEYLATRGNRGAWCLYRTEADVTHFEMLTFWDDTDAIKMCRHPVGSRRFGGIGGIIAAVFEVKKEIPSRILRGKTLPPLHRRNDGISTCPERFTLRKSAYLQRTPLGRCAGEGRNQGSLHLLVGRRGGQRFAEAVPGRCVL
jgi:hypothetical protein